MFKLAQLAKLCVHDNSGKTPLHATPFYLPHKPHVLGHLKISPCWSTSSYDKRGLGLRKLIKLNIKLYTWLDAEQKKLNLIECKDKV